MDADHYIKSSGGGNKRRLPGFVRASQTREVDMGPLSASSGGHYATEEYDVGMKVKTSVTLSEDVLKTVDRSTRKGESRSAAIERLLRESLAARARYTIEQQDRALLDRHAEALNAEVDDVLGYQADV